MHMASYTQAMTYGYRKLPCHVIYLMWIKRTFFFFSHPVDVGTFLSSVNLELQNGWMVKRSV
jgi:hypothetical protein